MTKVLYTSAQAANGRDTCGPAVKFQDAVVANGYVYVAGATGVTVYGLITPSTATPTIVTPAAASPATVTGTTTTLSVQASDPAADLKPVYTWAATAVPTGAAAPTFSVNGTNSANAPTVTFTRAGTYTLTCTITDPNSQLATTSSVTVTVVQTLSGVTVSPTTVTVPDAGTQQFAGTAIDQFGNALATQPAFTYAVAPGGAGGTVTTAGLYTAPATGTGSDTVTATSGSQSASATVTVAVPTATVQLNLSNYFNKVGIVADGSTFTNGGIDADGDGLSGTLLGTSKTWNNSAFTIGAATAADNVNNVVGATGQTLALAPQGQYATLKLLGLHLNGSVTGLTFTVAYTDGTTQTFTQSTSDWYSPQNYTGESKAVTMGYRDLSTGAKDKRTFYVYGYSFALNTAKTVQSLTLPTDTNFNLLSIDLLGVAVTVPAAASPSTVTGTTTALSVTGVVPTGDASPTYTWAATAVPNGATAPTFSANGTTTSRTTTATFSAAGTYTFTVTVADPTSGASAISSVTVTVAQTVTSKLAVSPATAVSLVNGATQQFTATAVDQFGHAIAAAAVTWSVVSPGVGSVSTTGLYTAPASGTGSATVQATANGLTATSAVVMVTLPAWLGTNSVAVWKRDDQGPHRYRGHDDRRRPRRRPAAGPRQRHGRRRHRQPDWHAPGPPRRPDVAQRGHRRRHLAGLGPVGHQLPRADPGPARHRLVPAAVDRRHQPARFDRQRPDRPRRQRRRRQRPGRHRHGCRRVGLLDRPRHRLDQGRRRPNGCPGRCPAPGRRHRRRRVGRPRRRPGPLHDLRRRQPRRRRQRRRLQPHRRRLRPTPDRLAERRLQLRRHR